MPGSILFFNGQIAAEVAKTYQIQDFPVGNEDIREQLTALYKEQNSTVAYHLTEEVYNALFNAALIEEQSFDGTSFKESGVTYHITLDELEAPTIETLIGFTAIQPIIGKLPLKAIQEASAVLPPPAATGDEGFNSEPASEEEVSPESTMKSVLTIDTSKIMKKFIKPPQPHSDSVPSPKLFAEDDSADEEFVSDSDGGENTEQSGVDDPLNKFMNLFGEVMAQHQRGNLLADEPKATLAAFAPTSSQPAAPPTQPRQEEGQPAAPPTQPRQEEGQPAAQAILIHPTDYDTLNTQFAAAGNTPTAIHKKAYLAAVFARFDDQSNEAQQTEALTFVRGLINDDTHFLRQQMGRFSDREDTVNTASFTTLMRFFATYFLNTRGAIGDLFITPQEVMVSANERRTINPLQRHNNEAIVISYRNGEVTLNSFGSIGGKLPYINKTTDANTLDTKFIDINPEGNSIVARGYDILDQAFNNNVSVSDPAFAKSISNKGDYIQNVLLYFNTNNHLPAAADRLKQEACNFVHGLLNNQENCCRQARPFSLFGIKFTSAMANNPAGFTRSFCELLKFFAVKFSDVVGTNSTNNPEGKQLSTIITEYLDQHLNDDNLDKNTNSYLKASTKYIGLKSVSNVRIEKAAPAEGQQAKYTVIRP